MILEENLKLGGRGRHMDIKKLKGPKIKFIEK